MLESEIYDDEILEAMKKLKRNKAHGEDCLLNEFFLLNSRNTFCHISLI